MAIHSLKAYVYHRDLITSKGAREGLTSMEEVKRLNLIGVKTPKRGNLI